MIEKEIITSRINYINTSNELFAFFNGEYIILSNNLAGVPEIKTLLIPREQFITVDLYDIVRIAILNFERG